ncbi:thaumatin family-domain-containing protein [Auriculariales sp. MPI-PUGE-AT-0066]|nr:thaumatin family-domain-containing protein [Auriculariales sp. MPI-PUGE-AT-0066]
MRSCHQMALFLVPPQRLAHRAMLLFCLAALMFAIIGANGSRTLTIINKCDISIWPVVRQFTLNDIKNFSMTDWEAATGTSHTVEILDGWSGDILARTGCTVDPNTNERSCESGICGDGLTCNDGFNASGTTVDVTNVKGIDYYSVLAYAYNLPVQIQADASNCQSSACSAYMLPLCADELRLTNSGGTTVACRSPCADGLDSHLACCSAENPCSESEKAYYNQLTQRCPAAVPGPPVWDFQRSCSNNTGFRITFCPVPDTNNGLSSSATTPIPVSPTQNVIVGSHAPVGAIAGGVVGGIVAVALLGICALLIWKRHRTSGSGSRPMSSINGAGATNYESDRDRGALISPFTPHPPESNQLSSPGANTHTTEVLSNPIWTISGAGTGKRSAAVASTPINRRPTEGEQALALADGRETFDAHGRVAAHSETDSGPNTIRGTDSEQHQTTPSAGTSTFENPHRDFPPPGYFSINHNQ